MLSYDKYEKELFELDECVSIDQYSSKIITINGILSAGEHIWKKEEYRDASEKIYPGEQYYGIEVITEYGSISAYITSNSHCCERFGAILSQDDISRFAGANLNRVYLTNTACQTEYLDYIYSKQSSSAEYCNIQFINFETNKGTFQLTVYNCDNGYYGHDVVINCDSDIRYKKTFSGCERDSEEQRIANEWLYEKLSTGNIKLNGYYNDENKNIVVPEQIYENKVVSIGCGCFPVDMEYLYIPQSIEEIDTWGDWIELKEIYVDPENAHYMSRHGVLYSKDGTKLIRVPSKIDSIPSDILSGVTHIEEYAFDEVVCITEIDIPESVVSIGDAAFAWCENLVKVSIADSVKSIGEGVFCGCHISQIKLPISITALEEYEYDEGLGFFMCCQFESFTVPNSVVSIGRRCFKSCNQLREVYIPASVQVIDELVFEGCSQLEAIRVAPNNPYFYDIDGVLYSREGTLIRVPQQYSVNSFNIKDGIGKIRGYAFSDCKKIEYINCPDSVMEIGNGAFLKSGLKTFTIPGKVTTINYNVFSCCLDLRELQIHKYVDTIDRTLFDELNYILSKTIVTVEKENSDFESRNGKLRRLRQ